MEFELSKIDAAVKQLDCAIRLCAASPIWSGASASSPRPIAVSAAGCIRSLHGQSSKH
jgi:hypothetical protein